MIASESSDVSPVSNVSEETTTTEMPDKTTTMQATTSSPAPNPDNVLGDDNDVTTGATSADYESTTSESTGIPAEIALDKDAVERNANNAVQVNEKGETIYASTTTGSPLDQQLLVESKEDYPEFSAIEAELEDGSDIADAQGNDFFEDVQSNGNLNDQGESEETTTTVMPDKTTTTQVASSSPAPNSDNGSGDASGDGSDEDEEEEKMLPDDSNNLNAEGEYVQTTTGSPLDPEIEALTWEGEYGDWPQLESIEAETYDDDKLDSDVTTKKTFEATTTGGTPLPRDEGTQNKGTVAQLDQEQSIIDVVLDAVLDTGGVPAENEDPVVTIQQATQVNGPLNLEDVQYLEGSQVDDEGIDNDGGTVRTDLDGNEEETPVSYNNLPSEKLSRKSDDDVATSVQDYNILLKDNPGPLDPGLDELNAPLKEEEEEVEGGALGASLIDTIIDAISGGSSETQNARATTTTTTTTAAPPTPPPRRLPSKNVEEEGAAANEADSAFPVTDILDGIYNLVQSYITENNEDEASDEDTAAAAAALRPAYTFSPAPPAPAPAPAPAPPPAPPLPINVHNAPRRDPLIRGPEPVDTVHSNTDPFVQLQAPNLRQTEQRDDDDVLFPVPAAKDPPRTISPFDSPALKVQAPPKNLLQEGGVQVAGPIPLTAPVDPQQDSEGLSSSSSSSSSSPSSLSSSGRPLFLPGNFLRGGGNLKEKLPPKSFLSRRNSQEATRAAVSINLPGSLPLSSKSDSASADFDATESIRRGDRHFRRSESL